MIRRWLLPFRTASRAHSFQQNQSLQSTICWRLLSGRRKPEDPEVQELLAELYAGKPLEMHASSSEGE